MRGAQYAQYEKKMMKLTMVVRKPIARSADNIQLISSIIGFA